MPFVPIKISRTDIFIFILSFMLVAGYVLVAGEGFPLDDSWIHQTYARNLAERGEWAFVPGEPSAASTSPLYTVLLSIGYLLNLPYSIWTHGLGAIALGITALLMMRLIRWQFPNLSYAPIVGGLFTLTTWHFVWAAASGMETIIFSMFTVLLIYLAWRELHEPDTSTIARGIMFGICSALTTLTRPEGVLLVAIIGLIFLIIQPQGSFRHVVVYGIVSLLTFLIIISPYLLLNYQLTGGILPNTATAKFQQHAILLQLPYLTRIQSLLIPILAGGQFLLIPGTLIYVWMIRHKATPKQAVLWLLPVIWGIALIGLYAARLPAGYQHGRYVIPALPSIVLVGTLGTLYAIQTFKYSLLPRVVSRALLASALLASIAFTVALAPSIYRTDVSIINEEMVASAKWIDDNIPQDDLLAIHDIGAVGYFTPRPMLDIAGLVSPEVAPIVDDDEALWSLMQERDARYLMAFPDQIPDQNVNGDRLCPIFTTNGKTAPQQGGANMAIYRLAWDGNC
jgi:4-amino-4-deoxy-L-arabinose transferase-like glycosyltransferase